MHVNSKNMTRSQYGQDATIVLDGTTIKRDSNSIDDMLTGVTLDLKKHLTIQQPPHMKH
jgi:Flagellar capping protein